MQTVVSEIPGTVWNTTTIVITMQLLSEYLSKNFLKLDVFATGFMYCIYNMVYDVFLNLLELKAGLEYIVTHILKYYVILNIGEIMNVEEAIILL